MRYREIHLYLTGSESLVVPPGHVHTLAPDTLNFGPEILAEHQQKVESALLPQGRTPGYNAALARLSTFQCITKCQCSRPHHPQCNHLTEYAVR